jgi:ATP-dependent RNA helicase MSS116
MRRCAQRASCATVGSHFLRHRILSPMTLTEKASSSKVLRPLSRYSLAFRNTYSTTADAAAEAVSENSTSEEKIYFKDLQDLGVNEALISTITQGMKYETMTPVQAKTIPPALKGTDM